MAQTTIPTLAANVRTDMGSRAVRRLRLKRLIPAELYGHSEPNMHLAVQVDDVARLLQHGVQLVALTIDGKTERALVKEAQHDYAGDYLIHVDFARVALDEKVEVEVAIDFRGTPAGLAHGGVVEYHLNELQVECLPMAIPESIRADVDRIEVNEFLHVRDIVAPEGVKILNDPEEIVVAVHAPKVAPEAAPVTEEIKEPEVIGEKKREEEEEEA
ncbi:MAG TPA: 50S ribosomal protein L25 [Planctomycetota bacterium]|nr:50S ribosomal protein L25 [Planctomycetota bacterium]